MGTGSWRRRSRTLCWSLDLAAVGAWKDIMLPCNGSRVITDYESFGLVSMSYKGNLLFAIGFLIGVGVCGLAVIDYMQITLKC